jgi:MFS family permease
VRAVLLPSLAAGLTTASQGVLELAYPLRQHELGDPLTLVGVAFALLGVGALLSRLPAGAWYRAEQAGLQIAASLVVFALTTVGIGFADVWAVQAALAVVHGFAFGLVTTFLLALLVDSQPSRTNAAPSIAWFTAAITTGYGLGSLLGARTIEIFSIQAAFVVSGGAGLVAVPLAARFRPARRAETKPAAITGHAGLRALGQVSSGVWLACLLGLYINFTKDAYDTFFPIYAVSIGISVSAVGVFRTLSSAGSAAIRFAAVGLLRLVPVGVVNHAGVLLMALSALVLSATTHEPLLAAAFVVLGTTRAVLRVTSATAVAEERERSAGARNVGMASAVYNAGLDAGSMLGPPAAGALAGAFDIPTSFRVVALALPALYYVIWLSQRRYLPSPLKTGLEKT